MKTMSFLLLCFLMLISFSCSKQEPGVNNSDSGTLKKVNPNALPTYPNFGVFPLSDPTRITNSGPTGSGWKGIILNLYTTESLSNLTAANSAGYIYIYGQINRDDVVNSNWTNVQTQISLGKNHGCKYFYIDDGLCGEPFITQDQIDHVATLVHQSGFLLASAEPIWDDQPLGSSVVGGYTRFDNNLSWYTNVDIIMPYGYMNHDNTVTTNAQLQSFFQAVKTALPNKTLIPFLGYHADIHNASGSLIGYVNQKGTASGDAGFIEMAKSFSTANLIFYYQEWTSTNAPSDQSNFNALTTYLRTYYNM